MHATGTFHVTMGQAEASDLGKAAGVGRMTIDKTWAGGIVGTSKGEMLMSRADDGAMAYVALEKLTGSVDGKSGTLLFTHRASMMQGVASSSVLEVTVVPNSGTGALQGIMGTLTITIDPGGHHYDFAYALPSAP